MTSDSKPVRVFISYSWDTEDHQKWVLALADRLRADGIEVILDQTHLTLGGRSPEFMERSVRDSRFVLVICTETYKRKFDNREGGAGYEGHIITGEIINEVGKNKFIPVLRSGDWKTSMPTALSGVYGVNLRTDSLDEYKKLVKHLHGVGGTRPVGLAPEWLVSSEPPPSANPLEIPVSDPIEYVEQRKRLADTAIMTKIWSGPRWCIWIRPAELRKARFQNLDQCRQFMLSSYVLVQGWYPYPWFSADSLETGNEWLAGEIDQAVRTERWVLFRNGQFVHNRALDKIPDLGDRVHVLEILDTVTGAFEFAARMAERGLLSPKAAITVDLIGVDGRSLTWPQDRLGDANAIPANSWCQEDSVRVQMLLDPKELQTQRREFALAAADSIYAKFGWPNPPRAALVAAQGQGLARN